LPAEADDDAAAVLLFLPPPTAVAAADVFTAAILAIFIAERSVRWWVLLGGAWGRAGLLPSSLVLDQRRWKVSRRVR